MSACACPQNDFNPHTIDNDVIPSAQLMVWSFLASTLPHVLILNFMLSLTLMPPLLSL